MKKCTVCKETKSLDRFNKLTRKSGKVDLQYKCRDCNIAYQKHYRQTKNALVQKTKKNKRGATIKWIRDYKTNKPCADCNQIFFHYVMDFDHIGDKKFSISHSPHKGYSLESIKKEIEKCELVCANCHRLRTWSRQGHPKDPKNVNDYS